MQQPHYALCSVWYVGIFFSFSSSLRMAKMEEEFNQAEKQRHATETTNQG